MNNVLLWLGGLLVVVLCALFAVPHFVDWTRYRGVLEEEASRVLGRELRVAGAVNLRLLPTPYVRFEKVRLADAAGQTGEPFFRADDFTLWLAPGPLLRGAIEARQIELRRPTLKLRLNAAGGGNWQSLSIVHGSLPFVPSDVALQSVLITDGTISVDGADARELMRMGGINGEFSASALDGPFRFKGTIDQDGAKHELKASTTAFDPDGSLRLKVQLARAANAGNFVLDGRLADLSGKPKLDGQISGQLGFYPSDVGRLAATASTVRAAGAQRLPIDVRAAVAADASGAKLTDIGLAFEVDGKPQLVAGTVDIGWQGDLAVKSDLNSRWLNLDQAFADKEHVKPMAVARRLAAAIGLLVPESARGESIVSVDQVTLGGEALSDFRLRVERADDQLRLTDLNVNLPGGSRASVSGIVSKPDAFDGDLTLRGANFSRLLGWLGYTPPAGDAHTDGVYALKSKVAFTGQSLAVKDAVASLGSATLTGSANYRWTERPRLDVVLDGDQIDLAAVAPKSLDLAAYAHALSAEPPSKVEANGKPAAAAAERLLDPKLQDATLRIRATRLRDATRDLRDVDVDVSLINGKLGLQRLRFTSANGLEIDAEGEVADVSTQGHGTLRGSVAAPDEAAISELLAIVNHGDLPPSHPRWKALAPTRAAWSVRFGETRTAAGVIATSPTELWLDGAVLGRRLTAVARIDGSVRQWRQAQVQVNLAVDRPDWHRLRNFVSPDTSVRLRPSTLAATPASTTTRARLLLNLSGRPDQGLSAFLKLDDDAFDAGLAGKVKIDGAGIGEADGELQLRTADLGQSLAVLGINAANIPGVALEGTADVAARSGLIRLTPSTLEVAGTPVGGEITVKQASDPNRQRIDGRITASKASIPRLLDMLLETKAAGPTRETEASIWSATSFDLAVLDRIEGRIRLEAAEVVLTSDLSLGRGVIDAELSPGKADIVALEGDVLGTRLTSRWMLQKAPAGVTFSGTASVADAQLERLDGAAGKAARPLTGRASVSATVNGRGLSPRSLITALTGAGEIEIIGGQIGALSLGALKALSDDVVNGKREPTIDVVEKAVSAMLADNRPETRLALGNRKLGFEIGDGAIKVGGFSVETGDGRAANRSTVDLSRLMIDSVWKLEQRFDTAKPKNADKKPPGPLPPATVVFVGSLASLGHLEPAISVEALVRELSVRRMERDVEKLEEVRRADEERARIEAERIKADAQARADALAAAATAAAAAAAAAASTPPLLAPASGPSAAAPDPATPPVVPTAGTPPPLEPPPAAGPGAPASPDTAAQAESKRRPSGVTSEQRQVPSSQRYPGQSVQDVFRRQGGN